MSIESSIPSQQIFSATIVEEKRYRRTLVSVINGVGIAAAIRKGLVVEAPQDDIDMDVQGASEDEQSLFIPEQSAQLDNKPSTFGSLFNPQASAFVPSAPATSQTAQQPSFGTKFGSSADDTTPKSFFGSIPSTSISQPAIPASQTPTAGKIGTGSGSTGFGFNSQSGFGQSAGPSIPSVFKGIGSTQNPSDPAGFASKPVDLGFNLGQSVSKNPFQSPSQAAQPVGPTSAQTDFTATGPSQFAQSTSTQYPPENESIASPISTSFGQRLFGQQPKETARQEEKPSGKFPLIHAPVNELTSASSDGGCTRIHFCFCSRAHSCLYTSFLVCQSSFV